MRVAIITFPGSNCDYDCYKAINDVLGAEAYYRWHRETDLGDCDAVILPGGFSYGDYLRAGAIARFSPIMDAVIAFAKSGGPLLGICNGFQVLCEAHLLPGALTRNAHLHFRNRDVRLRIESNHTAWTTGYDVDQEIVVPLKSGEGRYVADQATLDELEATGRVVARYAGPNPNGSMRDIAAISNAAGNVVGIMPHPEHAVEALTGASTDGLSFFTSVLKHLAGAAA